MTKDMTKRGFQTLPTENLSEHQTRRHQRSCGGCKALTCHFIHGSVAQDCTIEDCRVCGDLETIDDEISGVYDYFVELVQKRSRIIQKPNHESLIHELPAEILSLIFIYVKEVHADVFGGPSFYLPNPSPSLLVGLVCKKWRDITLRTPQLWTDIIVDTLQSADAQLNMINESARRAGALPLDIAISLEGDYVRDHEQTALNQWDDVAKALRSLVARWGQVAIAAPWSFSHKLLDQLEETPSITSFFTYVTPSGGVVPIKLQHPLRPKHFSAWSISGVQIPFEWDNLVSLDVGKISQGELLHIMAYAQKLRRCITRGEWSEDVVHYDIVHDPVPTTPITNRSLIHLETNDNILDYLILPSLQHLNCGIQTADAAEYIDCVNRLLNRSKAPLQRFLFDFDRHINRVELVRSLEKLPLLTSLTVGRFRGAEVDQESVNHLLQALTKPRPATKVILPRLQRFEFTVRSMGSSSWSLLSRFLRNDIQPRPLSRIVVHISQRQKSHDVEMDKDIFLHLLAVRKSGVELSITAGRSLENVFYKMARFYDVGPVH